MSNSPPSWLETRLDWLEDRYHDLLAWTLDHTTITVTMAIAAALLWTIGIPSLARTGITPVAEAAVSAEGARKPVRLEVRGPDASTLAGVARHIADEVRLVPGAADVTLWVARGDAYSRTGDRVAIVEANVSGREFHAVTSAIDARLATIPPPPGYRVTNRSVPTLPGFAGVLMALAFGIVEAAALALRASRRRGGGAGVRVAVIEASRERLRPTLLAAGILIGGTVVAMAAGGSAFSPFGVATIGGVIAATLATLLVIPVCYEVLLEG